MEYVMHYRPYVDISVLILCATLFIILKGTFLQKDNFKLFFSAVFSVFIMALSNIIYYYSIVNIKNVHRFFIYLFRDIYYTAMITVFVSMLLYILKIISLPKKDKKKYLFMIQFLSIFGFFTEIIINSDLKLGFWVSNDMAYEDYITEPSRYIYVLFSSLLLFLIVRYKNRFILPIWKAFIKIFILDEIVMLFQQKDMTDTFMSLTFFAPILIVLSLLHATPYDFTTGALDTVSFDRLLNNKKACKNKIFLSIRLDEDTQVSNIVDKFFLNFQVKYLKKMSLFRIGHYRFILVFEKMENNKDIINKLIKENKILQNQCKFLCFNSVKNIENTDEFIKMLYYFEDSFSDDIHFLTREDIKKYDDHIYILHELKDIQHKFDLNDPRVLVYCQPIYNVKTKSYDTAEALMRLKLPEISFVPPSDFISIAEEHNIIHTLSLIILNKVCAEIKKINENGYILKRISVNFAISELQKEEFIIHIKNVIQLNDINFSQIGIELTETQNDNYDVLKQKIKILKDLGVTLYLDDFGTGYSNLSKVLEFNFNVIKFDRSLLLNAENNNNGKYIVYYFSEIFRSLGYDVLYEGIETEENERLCINNHADYLQGYYYSKPLPIEQLQDFLEKK